MNYTLSRRAFWARWPQALRPRALLSHHRPHVHVWKKDPKYPWARNYPAAGQGRNREMLLDLMKGERGSRKPDHQVIHYRWTTAIWPMSSSQ